jgi:hypothetical protein
MPGLTLERRADGSRFVTGLLALTLGQDFGEGWNAFGEFAARRVARAADGGSDLTLDGGVAWAVTRDAQLDASFARGIGAASPRLEFEAGISIRF